MAAPTLAEFRDWMRVPETFTDDDSVLQLSLNAGVSAVTAHCGGAMRVFDLAAAVSEFHLEPWGRSDRDGWWCADIPDLMTETGLIVVAGGAATTSFRLTPRNAAVKGRPWTGIEVDAAACVDIAVTARWGWTVTPPNVQLARMMQAQRFYQRRDSPFGVAGSPDQGGQEMRFVSRYVDPDVTVLLRDYVRGRAVA